MFITITVSLGTTRYTYSSDKKTEISLEGELATLHMMAYGMGETVGSGMAALIEAEQEAQRKIEAEAATTTEE